MIDSIASEAPHVYRLALRLSRDVHLAEDIAQEALLQAVRHHQQLRSPDRLRVWMLRITANLWRDSLRRSVRNRTRPLESVDPPADDSAARAESQHDLADALRWLDSLPEKQRAVLHLFAVEELTVKEIGDVLDMAPGTVRVNLHHARQAMRKRRVLAERESSGAAENHQNNQTSATVSEGAASKSGVDRAR